MSTGFGLFRNSNLLTEQLINMLRIVILTLICIFFGCAFAGDSHQESKPGNEKHKSKVRGSCVYFFSIPARKNVNIRITVSTWLGIPFNKYLETDGTIVIHKKVLLS